MDTEKHIAFWRDGSLEDAQVAGELVGIGRWKHAMFFAHLAVEKGLKANVIRASNDFPPFIHNLTKLVDLASLNVPEPYMAKLVVLNRWQIMSRYEDAPAEFKSEEAALLVEFSKEFSEWLTEQL